MTENREKWWGQVPINDNTYYAWQSDNRLIAIKKEKRNFTIWDKTSAYEPLRNVISFSCDEAMVSGVDFKRVIVPENNSDIVVEPSLADRFIISRPASSIMLLAGQEIEFFVGTPLWFTIMHHDLDLPLIDVPFFRPSDAWFGKNTMEGEVCYATATDAKVDVNNLLKHPLRCYTKITVINRQDIPLALERLTIPVPELCVYVDGANVFWSDSVRIEQELVNGVSVSTVENIEPNSFENRILVSEARVKTKKASFMTSFKSLIG